MKNILIGNGINARLEIKQLDKDKIFDRFVNNAKRYVPLFESIFSSRITVKDLDALFDKSNKNVGIEMLAGKLYKYIEDVTTTERKLWLDNDDHRLQEILTCIGILSIFYDENGLIRPSIDETLLPDFSNYEKVFTLNYYEFWDYNNICIYLHGHIDYKKLGDKSNAFLYNPNRMNQKDYYDGIEKMKLIGNAVPFDPDEYVFAPEGKNKSKLTCIEGIFPSDRRYPSKDLYPIDSKELYGKLQEINELEVFGVSPYGDNDLIDRINSMNLVKIYVFQKSTRSEAAEWENKLKKCSLELEDVENI